MLCVIWTTFALSSAHYVTDFTVLIMRVESPEADEGSILSQADLMNAIIRINVRCLSGLIAILDEIEF